VLGRPVNAPRTRAPAQRKGLIAPRRPRARARRGLWKVHRAGVLALPDYLVSTIQGLCPKGDASVAIHGSSSIAGYKDASVDKEQIVRRRGFMGASQLEHAVYPNAVHHIKVFHNGQGKARVFYKYDAGNIKFLKRGRGRGGD
jgi:hypothetical protein